MLKKILQRRSRKNSYQRGRNQKRKAFGLRRHFEQLETRNLLAPLLDNAVSDPCKDFVDPLQEHAACVQLHIAEDLSLDELHENFDPINGGTLRDRTPLQEVSPGDSFRLEIYLQDLRDDDGVGGENFGVFAAYHDISYPDGFTVAEGPSIDGKSGQLPFAADFRNVNQFHPKNRNASDVSNGQDSETFRYNNGLMGNLNTPGLINDFGSFTGQISPLGKDEFFQADLTFAVSSVIGRDDVAHVPGGSTVDINVLANDELLSGQQTFEIAHAETFGPPATGTEFLQYGVLPPDDGQPTSPNCPAGQDCPIVPAERIAYLNASVNVVNPATSISIDSFTQGANGTVTENPDGTLKYTPNVAAPATDTFTYTVIDNLGRTATATVAVEIFVPTQIIDDGETGFALTGTWTESPNDPFGFNDDKHFTNPGDGSSTATWTFDVVPGKYRVSARWARATIRASNAPYTVFDNDTSLGTFHINQKIPPDDLFDAGQHWDDLKPDVFEITSNTLKVQLTNAADGLVAADAIRIERILHEPVQIVDNGDVDFRVLSDGWLLRSGGYQGDRMLNFTPDGTGTEAVQWTFFVEPGAYRVAATWTHGSNRTKNAPFTVLDNTTKVATVEINQEIAPNDFVDDGANWEDFGQIFNVKSGKMVVLMTDNAERFQFVEADGIRIERVTPPNVQIGDDNNDVSDGSFQVLNGTWTYRDTDPNDFQTDKTFIAAGDGTAVAQWNFNVVPGLYRIATTWAPASNRASNSPFTVLDGGKELATATVNQRVAPGDFSDAGVNWELLRDSLFNITSTRLAIELKNDADGLVVADGMRIERVEPAMKQIIDNEDAGYANVGTWTQQAGTGHRNDISTATAGGGADSATWTFDVTPGLYRVSATWAQAGGNASNAPYTVFDGANPLATVNLNQTVAPDDLTDAGSTWEDIGNLHNITSTRLIVQLTDNANNTVVADAIRIEKVTVAPIQVVDDGDANFAVDSGTWTQAAVGFEGDQRSANPGGGGQTSWTFNVLPGVYRIAATWTAAGTNASNAPFTIIDGTVSEGTFNLDQTVAPDDAMASGTDWEFIGDLFNIDTTRITVQLANNANGIVIADAIRIERLELPAVQIINNFDPGFEIVEGNWTYRSGGFGGDKHFNIPNGEAAKVRWSFVVEPGLYRVSSTWQPFSNRAEDTPFTVFDGSTPLASVDVNQELRPNDFTDAAVGWEDLGEVYLISTTSLVVEMTNEVTAPQAGDSGSLVIADAVRIERIVPPQVQIVDDGNDGFEILSGSWNPRTGDNDFAGDKHFAFAGNGSAKVQWTFLVEPGRYRVSATWEAASNRATDAPFTVFNGAVPFATVDINQKNSPNDFFDADAFWKNIGEFDITGTKLSVQLSDLADNLVIADAIRIQRLGDLP